MAVPLAPAPCRVSLLPSSREVCDCYCWSWWGVPLCILFQWLLEPLRNQILCFIWNILSWFFMEFQKSQCPRSFLIFSINRFGSIILSSNIYTRTWYSKWHLQVALSHVFRNIYWIKGRWDGSTDKGICLQTQCSALVLHGGMREPAPVGCLLASTCTLCTCVLITYTKLIIFKNKCL